MNKQTNKSKFVCAVILALCLNYISCSVVDAVSWYNNDWSYRVKVTVEDEKVTADQSNFPVMLDLNDLPDEFWNNVKSDGTDIVVTDNGGTTKLKRELETITTGSNAGILWFKAASLSSTSNSEFYLYYGNVSASESNDTTVWNDNYVIVAHLDDTPTGSADDIDDSVNNYEGDSQGSMNSGSKKTGKIGSALFFSGGGSSQYVDYGDVTELNSTDTYTYSYWVKSVYNYVCVGKGSYGSIRNLYYDSSDYYYYATRVSSYGSKNYSFDSNWHHIVSVFNGNLSGTSRYKFYIDGSEQSWDSTTGDPSGSTGSNTDSLYLGYDEYNGYYSNAIHDEFRVASSALLSSWISTEYNNQNDADTFYTVGSHEENPTDTVPPSISSLSPVDNGTLIAYTTNLDITFNDNIDIQTGNLYIKQASDDSIVQTIAVTTAAGNGTTSLSFNPSDLGYNTSYYIEIDNGALFDDAGNNYAGFTDNGTWNFTTAPETGTWYNSNWAYRHKITIPASEVDADLSNFPVLVDLNGLSATFWENINGQGLDILVTDQYALTESRELEHISTSTNQGTLWFKASSLSSTSNNDFYLYFGNSSANITNTAGVWNGYALVSHLHDTPTGSVDDIDDSADNYEGDSQGSMGAGSTENGKIHKALFFGGNMAAQYIDYGDVNEIDGTSAYSFSYWVKSVYNYVCLSKGSSGSVRSLYYDSSSYYFYPTRMNSYGDESYSFDSNWHYMVSVFNGNLSGTSRYKLYIDGSEITWDNTTGDPTSSTNSTADTLNLGYDGYNGYYTNAINDEFRVSKTGLLSGWISTEYDNQNDPNNFYTVAAVESAPSADPALMTIVSSLSPADNATTAAVDSNLVMNFSTAIDLQTGNITIKKVSDDSIVETIGVGDAAVTGNGTTTITINPTSDLLPGTAYYINIADAAFFSTSGSSYDGIFDSTSWNFTTSAWYDDAWTKRVRIRSQFSQVNGDLTDFPAYYDLSLLPDAFFDNVNANGTDLRVTDNTGALILAREVVALSKTDNTGELHFLAPALSSTANSDFYLYYGNASATEPSLSDSNGRNAVWNGYVAVWHMQEDVGSTVIDSTGNSHDGTHNNMEGDEETAAKLGRAYDFNASQENVSYASSGDFGVGTGEFNISAWVKPDTSNTDYIWHCGNTELYFILYSDSFYGTVDGNQIDEGSNNITTGNWHYGTMQRDSGTTKIYHNAVLGNSESGAGDSVATCGGNIATNSSPAYEFDGIIDEVRFASDAKSRDWIKTEFNNQNGVSAFWSNGDIETVSDTTNPTVVTYSPTDDNGSVAIDSNLVLTFDEAIDIQTGNLTIMRLSNDATAQTIDVTSGAVSGNGTTTITINPPSDLSPSTSYYINIATTAFDDNSANSYAGISDNGTWNFTTTGPTACTGELNFNGETIDADIDGYFHYLIDLDEDGDLDIVATDYAANDLIWYSNDGSGNFTANTIDAGLSGANGIYPADVDGDGDIDIVVAAYSASYVYWYDNDGSESFTKTNVGSLANVEEVYVIDVDGDSDMDIVASSYVQADLVWFDNDGSETFTKTNIDTSISGIRSIHPIDIDEDGDIDIALASYSASDVVWYDNDGSESFTKTTIDANLSNVYSVEVIDLDGDGDYDVLAAAYGADDIVWYDNDGSESFTKNTIDSSLDGARGIDVVDIDNDGDLDVLATGNVADDVVIYYNNGAEGFTELIIDANLDGATDINAADIDGDAVPDIVVSSLSADDMVWYKTQNCNDSTAPTASPYDPEDGETGVFRNANLVIEFNERVYEANGDLTIKKLSDDSTVETIDINSTQVTGNGGAFITINPTTYFDANTAYYINIENTALDDSAGNSYAGISDNSTWNFTTLAVAACTGILSHNGTTIDASVDVTHAFPVDLDEDGDMDIVVADYAASDLTWYENDGSESFTKTDIDASVSGVVDVNVVDLDEDGDLDIVVAAYSASAIYWYENDGSESFTKATVASLSNVEYVEVADIDGDSDLDVVAASYVQSDIKWYENDGNRNFSSYDIDLNLSGVRSIKVVDLDDDDDLDVVAASYSSSDLVWYDNDGSQTFTKTNIDINFSNIYSAFPVDMDLDGDIDILAAAYSADDVVWYENDGSESFTKRDIDTDLDGAVRADARDIDGDGDLDVVATGAVGDDLALYYNDGSQNFTRSTIDTNLDGAMDVHFVDLDDDGVLDILVSSNAADDLIWYRTENCLDTTGPTVETFNPVDEASGVIRNTNLVIEFSERVYEASGNITIKKTSDDTTVETIDVTSTKVTGNGGAFITIDPSTYLDANTDYYVQIDATAFDDSVGNSYAGITDTTTWNFTTLTVGACTGILSHNGITIDASVDVNNAFPVDLDGDGDKDIVVADYAVSDLTWYENDGSENFTKTDIDASVSGVVDVNVVDLDEDGDLDIVVAAYSASAIYWYENDGSESFTKNTVASLSNVEYVEVADMDGDSDLDIVAASYVQSDIKWYENDGSRDFTSYDVDLNLSGVRSIKVVDLDHDDDLDIVATSYSSSDLVWYDNDGSQTFTKTNIDINFSNIYSALPVDMDLDGDIDILATGYSADDVVWYENDGSESFTKRDIDTDLNGAIRADAKDIDGDGDLDVVATAYVGDDLALYYNDGSQNFTRSIINANLDGARDVHFVDLDDDGVLDILVSSNVADDLIWYKTENCIDTTGPSVETFTPLDDSTAFAREADLTIEFNEPAYEGSGNITIKKSSDDSTVETIAVTDAKITGNGSTMITINPSVTLDSNTEYYVQVATTAIDDSVGNDYAGISDTTTWSFTSARACNGSWSNNNGATIDAAVDAYAMQVIDLDEDGDQDIVVADYSSSDLTWYENDGSESFTKTDIDASVSGIADVEVVDLDKDGDLDIVVAAYSASWIYWYENDGAESFTKTNLVSLSNVEYVKVLDMDGDGDLDVLAASPVANDIYWYENDGMQNFMSNSIDLNIDARYIAPVDLDDDDDIDIVVADYAASDLTWYENDGSQGFTGADLDINFGGIYHVAPVDLDNDGDKDILAVGYSADDVVWYENDGSESFTRNDIDTNLDGAYKVAYGDIDNDGDTDILATGAIADDVILYTNDGSESFTSTTIEASFDGAREVQFADLNSDGVLDIIATSTIADDMIWWQTENCIVSSDPTVTTFSPADNGTGVSVNANLVITFNEAVDDQTGNIVIKQLSDDTVFETIPVGDARVTGNGGAAITINPNNGLTASTAYYVTIANTAFDDTEANSYAGISDNGTWNFTTGTATPQPWSNSAWAKRVKITVDATKVNGDLFNFPVYLDLNDLDSVDFFSYVRSDGGDIRVTQGDGLSLLATELVSLDFVNNAGELWFKADALSATNDTDFYVYYDNPNGRMLNANHPLGKYSVWSNGYVAVYHMDEDPNGDASEAISNSVSNSSHGTPSGTMTSADHVAGQIGNGSDLDGSDDYINFGDISAVDFASNNFEFSIWAKHDNTANQDHIFGKDSNTNGRQFEFRTNGSGGIRFSYWKTGPTQVYKDQSSVLDDTNWHLISAAKRGTSFEIYKDGSKIGSGTTGGTHGAMQSVDAPLFIGRREYSGFTEEFDGKFDEARISNKAHSQDWIETEYNNQSSPSTFYTVAGSVDNDDDTDNPQISLRYPRNRQDRFPLAADLFIDFNKTIQKGSGNITIMDTNGSTFETISIASTTVSGVRMTINPGASLLEGKEYYVLMDSGAIEDTSSNAFEGFSTTDGWRFTTESGKATVNTPFNIFMHHD